MPALTTLMLRTDDHNGFRQVVGNATWPEIERMIQVLQRREGGTDPATGTKIPSAAGYVVGFYPPKILDFLAEKQGFPLDNAAAHLLGKASADSKKVGEVCRVLQQHGAKITRSDYICSALYAAQKATSFHVQDVLPALLAMGLDLNAAAPEQKDRWSKAYTPILFGNHKSGLGTLFEEIATGIYLSDDLFIRADRNALAYIDCGCCFPEVLLQKFNADPPLLETRPYLPATPSSRRPNSTLSIVPDQIPRFLEDMRPEKLIGRCMAFNLMNLEVFQAILAAENQKREREGDTPLTIQTLFAKLAPFAQKHERMVSVWQEVHKQHIATQETGMEDLRRKARTNTRPKVE